MIRMTPPRPAPVVDRLVSADDGPKKYRYESLPEERQVSDSVRGARVLPPTTKLQQRLHVKKAATRAVGMDRSEEQFDADEECLWGKSSELVKKLPRGMSVDSDEAEEAPSAVISNGREILSQG